MLFIPQTPIKLYYQPLSDEEVAARLLREKEAPPKLYVRVENRAAVGARGPYIDPRTVK